MECLYCRLDTKVINSRHQKKINNVWRRRACQKCGAVFTSLEIIDLTRSISVKTASGHLEPFVRDKLFLSIVGSLGHRKDAVQAASALTATVISKLTLNIKHASLNVGYISQTTELVLKRFDKVAAVYYRAYYFN